MIRPYRNADSDAIKRLHKASGLPPTCLPDLLNPNFIVRCVAEAGGRVVQAGFVKLAGEAYVLIDHDYATAQERLQVLSV